MASMSNLEIETNRLSADIADLKRLVSRLKTTSEKMMGGINALSSMWEGEAKNAFTVQFQSDYKTILSMIDTLNKLIKSLENAKSKYNTCENTVGNIVHSIRV